MEAMESIKDWIQPKRDPNTLYMAIDEIPLLRHWGKVQLTLSNDVLISHDMALFGSAANKLLGWIERNLIKIRISGYQHL